MTIPASSRLDGVMTFDAFVAPLSTAGFLADIFGQRPIHLPAADRGGAPDFGWDRMNQLLVIRPHWTPGNLKLLLNSRPIEEHHYMNVVQTFDGTIQRADPAKIDLFLGLGASLVANAVEDIAPEIGAIADMLSSQFTALTGANVYCSFDGIQAFDTHYDTHEVFALQCEGEKVWRLYGNRAVDPLDPPPVGPDAQARINAERGPLVMEVRTRPGDLLYIPRGVYHDALAQRGASMHVSFAVAPRTGRALSRLIDEAIRDDPAFRAYLPGPDDRDGQALREALAGLADRIAATMKSPAFQIEVMHEQRRAAVPRHPVALPARPTSDYFARTERAAELHRSADGMMLVVAGAGQPLGIAGAAVEWALSRPAFSVLELDARFPHVPLETRRDCVAMMVGQGLIRRFTPDL